MKMVDSFLLNFSIYAISLPISLIITKEIFGKTKFGDSFWGAVKFLSFVFISWFIDSNIHAPLSAYLETILQNNGDNAGVIILLIFGFLFKIVKDIDAL